MKGLFKENIKVAYGSIRTQLLRTVLTIIIIAIGITALVGILTVVSALDNTLNSNFASMGSNTFSINQEDNNNSERRRSNIEKQNPIITYAEAKLFKDKYTFPFQRTSLSFDATRTAEIKYESEKTDPEVKVIGIDEYFIGNTGLEITQGRAFNTFDVTNNVYGCIIGSDFGNKGLLKDINPIDKILSIRGAKFKVIGVLKEQGSSFGDSKDLQVLIPIQVARSLFSAPNINYSVNSMVDKTEYLEKAIAQATQTMRKIRKLNPIEENNFGISRSDELINKIASLTGVLGLSAWVIGIITILGSSIALMNIMVVSVTERTREIGVRKSLGAKKSTIAWQFFVETLMIGQIGGLIGIVFGIFIGFVISKAIDFDFVIPWMAIFAAFVTSFIVAIVSGLYPALKAAKLDPIEALRYE